MISDGVKNERIIILDKIRFKVTNKSKGIKFHLLIDLRLKFWLFSDVTLLTHPFSVLEANIILSI